MRNLQEFVERARLQPGKLSVANEGPKAFSGILARLLNSRAGIDTNLVAYASVVAGVTETVGGQTDAILCDLALATQMARNGRLRPIAVTTARRVAGWEDVPPMSELLPGFDFAGWLSVVAPSWLSSMRVGVKSPRRSGCWRNEWAAVAAVGPARA
jgi:tripartite-type tricarboxylate transporter receptor subunit TctC